MTRRAGIERFQSQIERRQPKALARYQTEIVTAPWFGPDGKARTITCEKARRIGLSEAAAIKVVGFCLGLEFLPDGGAREQVPMSGIVVSKDFPSAKELLAKVAANVRDLAAAGDADCRAALPYVKETKIHFPTKGTTVRCLAGQGSTIRSWTGFVVLDEFAFVRNQEEVWGAARPVTDANWANRHGYPMLVISTPWESGSLAHRVFTELPFEHFSFDIHRAVADGFPIDVEAKFAELGIRELIETEYLCMWSRGGEAFFPAAKLRECLRDDGQTRVNGDGTVETADECGLPPDIARCPRFYGVDVGGGTGRDFTACVQFHIVGDEFWITGVRAFNNLGIHAAIENLSSWIARYPGEVRVDRGVMAGSFFVPLLEERLQRSHSPVVAVGMDPKSQEDYAGKMKRLLEAGQLRIYTGTATGGDPHGTGALILEMAQLKARVVSGRLHLETPRDPLRGHCDRAWAAMIALSARATGRVVVQGGTGYRPQAVHEQDFESRGTGFG